MFEISLGEALECDPGSVTLRNTLSALLNCSSMIVIPDS